VKSTARRNARLRGTYNPLSVLILASETIIEDAG